MIHTIAVHFNPNYSPSYIQFYNSLRDILPCGVCRGHYRDMIHISGLRPEQNMHKNTIHAWTVNLHNQVNARLNKPQFSLQQSFERHRKFDHNLAFVFIDLMIQLGLKKNTNDRLHGIRKMISSLSEIYPCEECRNKLQHFSNNNPIMNIPTANLANKLNEWRSLLHPHINLKWTNSVIRNLHNRENNRMQIIHQGIHYNQQNIIARNKAIQMRKSVVPLKQIKRVSISNNPVNRAIMQNIIRNRIIAARQQLVRQQIVRQQIVRQQIARQQLGKILFNKNRFQLRKFIKK
jgi:hypothetical protein